MSIARGSVLIIDDDVGVRELVSDCLGDGGYEALEAGDGATAVEILSKNSVDLVVVDLGLPDIDGLALTQQIKTLAPGAGIIILSGRSGTVERIVGLEVGADDYLGKPFDPRELLARVKSVLRRIGDGADTSEAGAATGPGPVYVFDGFRLDVDRVELTTPLGEKPKITGAEFGMLKTLVEHPNRVLTRDFLLDMTHNNDMPAFDRSIDVQITRLRKKLEKDPRNPELIKTIRNQGYMFATKVSKE